MKNDIFMNLRFAPLSGKRLIRVEKCGLQIRLKKEAMQMKQLGNLAMVCARRRSILFMSENGEVRVTIRKAPGSPSYYLRWDDDKKIEEVIHELNFGKYRNY